MNRFCKSCLYKSHQQLKLLSTAFIFCSGIKMKNSPSYFKKLGFLSSKWGILCRPQGSGGWTHSLFSRLLVPSCASVPFIKSWLATVPKLLVPATVWTKVVQPARGGPGSRTHTEPPAPTQTHTLKGFLSTLVRKRLSSFQNANHHQHCSLVHGQRWARDLGSVKPNLLGNRVLKTVGGFN